MAGFPITWKTKPKGEETPPRVLPQTSNGEERSMIEEVELCKPLELLICLSTTLQPCTFTAGIVE